ncbi:MAG: Rrf2 family transcriptional regulator [Planctomycetota bacterium]|nr:MAG: Rrf2 family transcriptional regulator [Planctomycetota bacterium]
MISQTGQYALRACVYLAQEAGDAACSGARIAGRTGIPAKYLSKILGDLVHAGVLDATRGKGGGFRLRRPPADLRLLEILSPFESSLRDDSACPFRHGECSSRSPCPGHDRWRIVKDGFRSFVQDMTLAAVATSSAPAKTAPQRKGKRT